MVISVNPSQSHFHTAGLVSSDGWSVSPASVHLDDSRKGESVMASFRQRFPNLSAAPRSNYFQASNHSSQINPRKECM